jgi:chitinase
VNLIGYYGNSGSCADSGCTPTFDEIPSAYNVIIMTFLNINDQHELVFEISNNAPVTLNNLATQAAAWKSKSDPWGRRKLVLVSLGGQNGHWPSDISDNDVVTKLRGFMQTYGFDGLDIDFESSVVQYVEKNIGAFRQLKNEGFVLCAAPEAAQGPLTAYRLILADLDWVHPQFYNNPPNAVTTPFVPQYESHATWQTPSNQPWWLVTMDTTANLVGMSANARGIAIPATPQAAGNNNNWDLNLLASQVRLGDIRNVATWALGYDKTNNWQLAQTIAALNNNDNQITTATVETTTTAANCVNVKSDSECKQANTNWNMCTTAGDWWKNQCKKECSLC